MNSVSKKSENKIEEVLCELDKEYESDQRIYIEQNLYIKTKDQQIILLKFNTPQEIIYKKILEQRAKNKPLRFIILKARQEGVSTLCEALIFTQTARQENTNALIVAHEPESTEEIFRMSKIYYDMLEKPFRPMRRYDNKKQMVFENPNEKTRAGDPGIRSKMVISTADKVKIGRGLTLHCFHGSEVAFWKNAKELMLSVMQAIPDLPKAMVFLESTAKGF